MNERQAASQLGVTPQAGDEEIRRAYLARVQQYPPDRCPEQFERIRQAYDLLRDPRARARHRLFSLDPAAPLTQWLDEQPDRRPCLGPQAWLTALQGG